MDNRPAYIVALAAGNGFQDVHDLLRGINGVRLHAGVLAPRAGTRTATGGFSPIVSFTFHTIHNFGIFAARKPKVEKGGESVPLAPCLENSDLKGYHHFPNSQRNSQFHFSLGFRFSYSLQGFRMPLSSLSKDTAKIHFLLKYTSVFQ